MEMVVDILSVAASAGNYALILVEKQGNKHRETTKCEGSDDTLSMYLFLKERMVKLVKRVGCKAVFSTYKEAILSKSRVEALKVVSLGTPLRTPPQWSHEVITGDDLIGLTWILKMHAGEVITRREAMATPTEGEISWTRDKFEAINRKGKCDLLKYLAIKTGSELLICNAIGKGRTVIKGRNMRSKIRYNTATTRSRYRYLTRRDMEV